ADVERVRGDLARAVEGIGADWKSSLPHQREAAAEAVRQREAVAKELAELESAATLSGADAELRAKKTEAACAGARVEHETVAKQHDESGKLLATLQGQLEERRRAAAQVDRAAAQAVVKAAEAALAQLPPPPAKPATEADRAQARARLAEAERALRDLEDELKKSEGALERVGGNVAEERLADQERALDQAREHERELERDYGAWQLLLATLNDAAREQSTHLGKCLVEPVAQRFRALTDERYSGV